MVSGGRNERSLLDLSLVPIVRTRDPTRSSGEDRILGERRQNTCAVTGLALASIAASSVSCSVPPGEPAQSRTEAMTPFGWRCVLGFRDRADRRPTMRSCGGGRPSRPGGATDCRRSAWRSGEGRSRTGDTTIFSRMLYQLSYLAALSVHTVVHRRLLMDCSCGHRPARRERPLMQLAFQAEVHPNSVVCLARLPSTFCSRPCGARRTSVTRPVEPDRDSAATAPQAPPGSENSDT
jgi:hypothetical protein